MSLNGKIQQKGMPTRTKKDIKRHVTNRNARKDIRRLMSSPESIVVTQDILNSPAIQAWMKK